MSLDTWLGHSHIRHGVLDNSISSKRIKIDHSVTASRSTRASSCIEPAPKFRKAWRPPRLTGLDRINCGHYSIPPESRYGRRQLFGWTASPEFQGEEHISSLACIPDAPLAVLGLDSGEIEIVQCSNDLHLGVDDPKVGSSWVSSPTPSGWPIVDITAINSQTVLCASRRGVGIVDVPTGRMRDYVQQADDEITHLAVMSNHEQQQQTPNIVAISGSSGSIRLMDTRDPQSVSRRVVDAHSILSGPRANRQRPAISAMTWANEKIVATGSQSNDCVKFWDIRSMRRTPVMSTQTRNGLGKCEGINSLNSRGDGSVWALTREGSLLKLSQELEQPLFRLESPQIKISSPYQSLELIPFTHSEEKGRNRSPGYPLLAACSDSGIVLATEPSIEATKQKIDSTFASKLTSSSSSKISAVRWHPYTKELVSIVAHRGWQMWAHNGPNVHESWSKPVKIRMKDMSGEYL